MADQRLNHHTQVHGGLLADDCGRLLRDFFAQRRTLARATAADADSISGNNNAAPKGGIEVEFLSNNPPDDL